MDNRMDDDMNVDSEPEVNLQLFSTQICDKQDDLRHTYLLALPSKNNNVTFRINHDEQAYPNADSVKQCTRQPWYKYASVAKYHMLNLEHHNSFSELVQQWTMQRY